MIVEPFLLEARKKNENGNFNKKYTHQSIFNGYVQTFFFDTINEF